MLLTVMVWFLKDCLRVNINPLRLKAQQLPSPFSILSIDHFYRGLFVTLHSLCFTSSIERLVFREIKLGLGLALGKFTSFDNIQSTALIIHVGNYEQLLTFAAYTQKSDLLNLVDKDMSHCSSSWQLFTVM